VSSIKIVDEEIRWHSSNGSLLRYYPYFQRGEQNEKNPSNHPIYAVDTDMGSCILQFDDSLPDTLLLRKPTDHITVQPTETIEDDL
jgi:hypothetical protein